MDNVRVSTDCGHPQLMKWCGAATIDEHNHVERLLDIPEEIYAKIESGINQGYVEGTMYLPGGCRYHWVLDRHAESYGRKDRLPAPEASPPPPTGGRREPPQERVMISDQFDPSPHKVAYPPGDFASGFLLGEFCVNENQKSETCPTCGQAMLHPEAANFSQKK